MKNIYIYISKHYTRYFQYICIKAINFPHTHFPFPDQGFSKFTTLVEGSSLLIASTLLTIHHMTDVAIPYNKNHASLNSKGFLPHLHKIFSLPA